MSETLHDPFGRSRLPAGMSREERVRLIGEAFAALAEGRMPSPEAASLLGTSGLSWLEAGGDLARDHLRVIKAKSHNTPARVWAQLNDRSLIRMRDTADEKSDDTSSPQPTSEADASDATKELLK